MAAEDGHRDIVELLLAHKDIQVNEGNHWRTPLCAAAENGHRDIVELLLAHKDIQVNEGNHWRTPLCAAAENGHRDIVELLLAHKDIQVNEGNHWRTPLCAAAENGHRDIVELLLAHKDIQVNEGNHWRTPLCAAAENGHRDIVKLLISRDDIDLNGTHYKDWTPLSFAIARGHLDVMKLLLPRINRGNYSELLGREYAVEAAIKDDKCYVIELLVLKEDIELDVKKWDYDVQEKLFEVVRPFLLKNNLSLRSWGTYDQPIVLSIMNTKDLDTVERLLTKYDMHSPNRTLLSWAAENGYKAVVRYLLVKAGVNPNIKDDDGRTPLSRASENGHEIIVKLLLGNKTMGIRKKEGQWYNEEEKELLLIQNSADPNLEDDDGQTPLSWALKKDHGAILELLVPIDTTTLFLLVKEGNREAIKSLIFAGPRLDERNRQGKTLLHTAILSGQLKVVTDLISYGAEINLQDIDNMTPLQLAVQKNDGAFIQELLKKKAEMKGIMVNEWRDAYSKESIDILQISEALNGERQVEFTRILPTASQLSQAPFNTGRYLYSITDDTGGLAWSKVPITHIKEHSRPNELYVNISKGSDNNVSDISLCVWFSVDDYLSGYDTVISAANVYRIAWKMNRSTKPGSPWVSTVYFSTLPNGWMPENDLDLFQQFIFCVKETWLKLCQQLEIRLSSRRLEQLKLKGKSPDMIDSLANDAKNLAELRNTLHNQIQAAENFIKDYCRYYNANKAPKGIQEELKNEFKLVVDRIGQLDQVIRDLLQIEFAWASINETRISTRLGQNVMLLTYVSIFYLPLGFCAALWAIPDITNPSTRSPFIISSVIICLVTLLVTFNMEQISGMAQRIIHSAKDVIRLKKLGKNGQHSHEQRASGQSKGFSGHIKTFLVDVTQRAKQVKQKVSPADASNV
ncbi:hypothetical protein M441DRAFT_70368 [Trichoderma asperellum CBS 433.97]|uniref:Uncharacterized protein n=1 Tax=Trichoderma asperellum (strain ATCC 204424 / CBS 433.97 / NBRC 101777) TaxID=1042311 RepID=A0A2T3Z342_TRIA4|nr:hypothetical protein M441DRAFT_70368 [Trichoderma asperellum CBS 433.97]PTB39227.1 hypothetical protein M441DRAFT_70368 [Trichoderma asperellum CBS 433.97]